MQKYEPVLDYIMVKKVQGSKMIGSVLLPESAQPKNHGEVISMGPGRQTPEGVIVPIRTVKIGDIVVYNKAIEFENDMLLTRESELLCVVRK